MSKMEVNSLVNIFISTDQSPIEIPFHSIRIRAGAFPSPRAVSRKKKLMDTRFVEFGGLLRCECGEVGCCVGEGMGHGVRGVEGWWDGGMVGMRGVLGVRRVLGVRGGWE